MFWKFNIPASAEVVNILHLADCQREWRFVWVDGR